MHIDSDKCHPTSSCYALTRGSLNNVRKGGSGFAKNSYWVLKVIFCNPGNKIVCYKFLRQTPYLKWNIIKNDDKKSSGKSLICP